MSHLTFRNHSAVKCCLLYLVICFSEKFSYKTLSVTSHSYPCPTQLTPKRHFNVTRNGFILCARWRAKSATRKTFCRAFSFFIHISVTFSFVDMFYVELHRFFAIIPSFFFPHFLGRREAQENFPFSFFMLSNQNVPSRSCLFARRILLVGPATK